MSERIMRIQYFAVIGNNLEHQIQKTKKKKKKKNKKKKKKKNNRKKIKQTKK